MMITTDCQFFAPCFPHQHKRWTFASITSHEEKAQVTNIKKGKKSHEILKIVFPPLLRKQSFI